MHHLEGRFTALMLLTTLALTGGSPKDHPRITPKPR